MKKLNLLIYKYFILLIVFILSIFLLKNNFFNIKDYMFKDAIDYSYFRSKTNFLIGMITKNKTSFVTSDKLEYKKIIKEGNSFKFIVDDFYVLNAINDGVVIYIGDNKSTITISGDDGINYTYSNLENISVKLYDYVKKGSPIGSAKDKTFYLTLEKDGNYLDYEKNNYN